MRLPQEKSEKEKVRSILTTGIKELDLVLQTV